MASATCSSAGFSAIIGVVRVVAHLSSCDTMMSDMMRSRPRRLLPPRTTDTSQCPLRFTELSRLKPDDRV